MIYKQFCIRCEYNRFSRLNMKRQQLQLFFFSFFTYLHSSHPWTCDLCQTQTLTPVNTWSSGSHIVCLQAEELPWQSGVQMWNLIEVGSLCRRCRAPAKARPGIHRTLLSTFNSRLHFSTFSSSVVYLGKFFLFHGQTAWCTKTQWHRDLALNL